MMKTEPLMNATWKRHGWSTPSRTHFVTPETDEIGVGDIKEERMAKAIKLLVETYGLAEHAGGGGRVRPRIPAAEGRAHAQAQHVADA